MLRSIRRFSYTSRFISTFVPLKNKTYTETHEWIYSHTETPVAKMGLSKHAVEELGEIVYVDFNKEKGDIVEKDDEIVSVESVKATGSILAPYDGVIVENNILLEDPDILNILSNNPECEENSWFIKIEKL